MIPQINLIVAYNNNRVIGSENTIPWYAPEDFKHFRELTTNNVIVMGRHTFESLPHGALPNRHNIVLSNVMLPQTNTILAFTAEGALSLAEAYADINECEIFIIGGESIYNLFMPFVNRLYITEIDDDSSGDRYFPEVDIQNWELVNEDTISQCTFKTFDRKQLLLR